MLLIDGLKFEVVDFEKSATAKRKWIDNRFKDLCKFKKKWY